MNDNDSIYKTIEIGLQFYMHFFFHTDQFLNYCCSIFRKGGSQTMVKWYGSHF